MKMKQKGMDYQRQQEEQTKLPVAGGIAYDHQMDIWDMLDDATYYWFALGECNTRCAHCLQVIAMNEGPLCWFCNGEQADQLWFDFVKPRGETISQKLNQAMQNWVHAKEKLPLQMGN